MHECPDCGQACGCCGDIEDHMNEQPEEGCECPCWAEEDEYDEPGPWDNES